MLLAAEGEMLPGKKLKALRTWDPRATLTLRPFL